MFLLQSMELELVGLVLRLLLKPAGPARQLVLFLPRFRPTQDVEYY